MTPASAAHHIESVENAAKVLLMLKEHTALRVADVASDLGIARSSAHRMLTTLQAHGLLRQEPATRAYRAGPQLVALGMAVIGAADLRSEARPILEELVRHTGETAHVIVLEGTEIVFVDGIESTRVVRAVLRTGVRAPAHPAAAGKALLAELPLHELRARYPSNRLRGGTERSLRTRKELERELEGVRSRGFAVNLAESEPGVHAVAAAARDTHGVARGALSVSGPSDRLSEVDLERISTVVSDCAQRLGRTLS